MKKLWVRWVALTLLVIVLSLVMIRLGQWQLHRLSGDAVYVGARGFAAVLRHVEARALRQGPHLPGPGQSQRLPRPSPNVPALRSRTSRRKRRPDSWRAGRRRCLWLAGCCAVSKRPTPPRLRVA